MASLRCIFFLFLAGIKPLRKGKINVCKKTFSASSPLHFRRKSPTNYYLLPRESFPEVEEFGIEKRINYDCSRPIGDLLRISLVYNCRISELLNANYSDILNGDRIVLHGSKHSRDFVAYLPSISLYRRNFTIGANDEKIWKVPYKQAWTQIKKAFSFPVIKGRSNDSIYHIGRYLVVAEIEKQGIAVNLQDVLRHNSRKSQLYYIK